MLHITVENLVQKQEDNRF